MWWIYQATIYFVILCLAAITGLIQYKKLDKASKLIVVYLVITSISEGLALFGSLMYKNNLVIYHLYCPIQFLLLSIYFNLSPDQKKINAAGWIIGLSGLMLSIINSIFFQPPLKELNTNFIVIESFLIIGMSLFSFYRLLASDIIYIHLVPKFWFSSIFLVFWSFTFFYWLVGVVIYKSMPDMAFWLNIMIWFINIVTYSAIAAVFLSYNKMKPS